MKKRMLIAAVAATALTVGTTIATTAAAHADEPPSIDQIRDQLIGNVDSQVIDAMKHDLGLTTDGAYQRLAVDHRTTEIADIATTRYGGDYAGTWVNEDGTGTTVAVTDPALADDITDLGATPTIVDTTLDRLTADKAALDAIDTVPAGVYSWAVDITANSVLVNTDDASAAQDFIDQAGITATINDQAAQPQTMASLVGGDAYYINGSARCSIGFPITYSGGSGFVSAGHCGSAGDSVSGADQSSLGQFQASTFPGSDYSWVAANSGWTAEPVVNGYGQGDITVTDGSEAATGASVCRSGSTTGLHCGTVGAKDQTVQYAEGTVYGMTETDVCAEPGDSGGSWISGGSAQGVTSGGSGDCTSGGVTYFFPLTDILAAYPEVTLATG